MDDDGMAELYWAVGRRLRRRTREALTPWEITPAQSVALGVLLRGGPRRLNVLAERLGIAPRSATEVVDHLQERGLVERRPDTADRRATLVTLTEAGRAAGEEIRDVRAAAADRFFGVLSDADREILAALLRKLAGGGEEPVNEG